ncbi:MAG: FHA domain-containing protein [Planctomycetaceae bacterium]|nr:FHA domain-containing protein [Planctomycetaceae bacterium]
MMHAEFKVLGGKHQGRSIPINTKKFLVGREQDCHLRPNNDLVSRHHCVFIVDDYTVRLRDLGSTNGTRVNGELVRNERVLADGDRITIGKLELEIVIREHAAVVVPTAAVPVAAVASVLTDAPLAAEEMGVSANATIELPISGLDTTNQEAGETAYEMPAFPGAAATQPMGAFAGDTAILGGGAMPGMMPGMMPMGMPPGYPMMPGYPQQMGYPQGYPGYPQPGYPMGYPMQQMPGYPMMPQGYPGMPMPTPAAPESTAASREAPVKLPPPESTGLPAPPPPPPVAPAPVAAADGSVPPPPPSDKPSNTAADIIKNYMQRRSR